MSQFQPYNEYEREERVLGFILRHRAQKNGDKPFLLHADGAVSYAELHERTNRVANCLLTLGIHKGDRVAILLPTCVDFVYLWCGLAKMGAIEVPINLNIKDQLLAYVLNDCQAETLVVDSSLLSNVLPIWKDLYQVKRLVLRGDAGEQIGGLGVEVVPFSVLLQATPEEPDVEIKYSDPAYIIYTSGTTGRSKGVLISQHQMYWYAKRFVDINHYTTDDVLLNALPYYHVAGKFTTLGAWLVDARLALMERFSASAFWDQTRQYGATSFIMVGAMARMLYNQPARSDDGDNPVRVIYSVPAPADIYDEFCQRFNVHLVEAYGSTEVGLCLNTPYDLPPSKIGSCGLAAPSYQVTIVDGNDVELPPGQAGEIVVRPREPFTTMLGYYNQPEATLDTTRNLWLHTGDRGYRDEDGYFYFIDRLKDSIRRRGENISSFEVERLVNQHPAVAESAAIPVPSELGEDEIKICVVLKPGHHLLPEELIPYCQERMGAFMVPRYVEFFEALPKTPTERVEKYKLRGEGSSGITERTWDREKGEFVLLHG